MIAREQQIPGHRRPDHAGAHHGDEREQGHDHAPEHRGLDAQYPEDETAQRALGHGHQQAALDRGPQHFGELGEEQVLAVVAKGQGPDEQHAQLLAIAHQEKGQIEHDAEVHEEVHRAAAQGHGVARHQTADLDRQLGKFLGDDLRAVAVAGEPVLHAGRHLAQPFQRLADVMPAGRQAGVQVGHLIDEGIKNVRAGHDDEHQAQDHAGQRRQVAAHAAALQGIVDGRGEQSDDDAPEDDIEEGAQHPEEGQRDAGQQQEEGTIFKTVVAFEHGDSLPGLRAVSVGESFRYRKSRGQANAAPFQVRLPVTSAYGATVCDAPIIRARRPVASRTRATAGERPVPSPGAAARRPTKAGKGGRGRERLPRPCGDDPALTICLCLPDRRFAAGRSAPSCGGGMVKVL